MPAELASLKRRVRLFNWLFRLGLSELPSTAIGRPVLRDLVRAYETVDEEGRRSLRDLLGRCSAFSQNVALPRPVDSDESFRQHLLHFALIHDSEDSRDARLWLWDLCREAEAAGVTIEPILRQVCELAGGSVEDVWSAKGQLLAASGYTPAP